MILLDLLDDLFIFPFLDSFHKAAHQRFTECRFQFGPKPGAVSSSPIPALVQVMRVWRWTLPVRDPFPSVETVLLMGGIHRVL
jgi:hypothetical protein